MKMFRYIILLLVVGVMVSSCDEESPGYGDAVPFERDDSWGALSVVTTTLSFVAGTPDYSFEFLASQGSTDAITARVMKTFTDSKTGSQSDTALLADFTLGATSYFSAITDFDELRSGLTVDGMPLPTEQTEIGIGSKWTLLYYLVDVDGEVVLDGGSANTTEIAVLSPFAGRYVVTASDYWRIGVQSDLADFVGEERFIGSINDTTFNHTEYIGPLGPSSGFAPLDFIFYKDASNNLIIPPEVDGETQPMWGTYFITCESEPASFTNVSCIGSNKLVVNGAGPGKHQIFLTYGYESVGSGTREFYEVLEKIVE